jgi:hypothetical protein
MSAPSSFSNTRINATINNNSNNKSNTAENNNNNNSTDLDTEFDGTTKGGLGTGTTADYKYTSEPNNTSNIDLIFQLLVNL